MIVTDGQAQLREWLCERIGLVPTRDLVCIGRLGTKGLVGVVGFDQFNGASAMMHSAGEGNWLSRDMLYACFDYPFRVCGVNMVIGLVPSGNTQALRFNKHIGFKTELVLDGAHPDGSLVLMTMRRGECRYLTRNRPNGQEISSPASA